MEPVTITFTAIGTVWNITVFQAVPGFESVILPAIHERIALFDANYSRFRTDSWLNTISQKTGTYQLPSDAELLFSQYQKLYLLSEGQVTPLIGKRLVELGYDPVYSLQEKETLTPIVSWESVLEYNPPTITTKQSWQLDVGALGKGYLVDIVSEILSEYGVTEYSVDAGGDIAHRTDTERTLRVGLENPFAVGNVIGVLSLQNGSIAGSAGNRRRWGSHHHIVSGTNGISPETIAAVWVVAQSTLIADAMTTGLFFVSPEVLLQEYEFEYLLVHSDGSLSGTLLDVEGVELF